jgi:hypothetical protein
LVPHPYEKVRSELLRLYIERLGKLYDGALVGPPAAVLQSVDRRSGDPRQLSEALLTQAEYLPESP